MKAALLHPAQPPFLAALQAAAPGVELAAGHASIDEAAAALDGADACIGNHHLREGLARVDQAHLRWVQTPSVGVEAILPALRNPLTSLTNARGVYDADLADHALALALACLRLPPGGGKPGGRWERSPLPRVADRPALVLGLGGLGRALAQRLAACGATVWATRRTPGTAPDGVAELLGPDEWRSRLPQVGLLALALPLTAATRGIVGRDELLRLPPDAAFVNVARGALVDEAALVALLRAGRLRAGLDVFEHEPLPPAHPLWTEPRAIVTPHVARPPDGPLPRWADLAADNLRRFVHGEPLRNVVSREHGY